VDDAIFFIKDIEGRYIAVNQSLVERCGKKHKWEIIGKTVSDLYPANLAEEYSSQDREVLRTGRRILGKLEVHLYPDRSRGWCLTSKIPLHKNGKIIGLAGISHDIGTPDEERIIPSSLAVAVTHLQERYDQPLTIAELASKAGLPKARFARLVKKIFRISPGQLLVQIRVQAAMEQLKGSHQSVVDIALACGFGDQSAFTRRFKAVTGFTPVRYRRISAN